MDDALDHLDIDDLTERYVALWNEPDPGKRRHLVELLWVPDGGQVLVDPPAEVRALADFHRFRYPELEVHGHAALEARVTRNHENVVASGEQIFAAAGTTRLLRHVVGLAWELVSLADDVVTARGLNVFDLDDDGRIRLDHLYIVR
jgi:hypothetical protein